MVCCASAGAISSANTTSKKSTPRAAIVKGLISQFTTRVMIRPLRRSWTRRTAEKSTATIIG